MRPARLAGVALLGIACAARAVAQAPSTGRPFGAGERVSFRISWASLLAGRAELSVEPTGLPTVLRFVLEATSEGLFTKLVRFSVQDRTVAHWDVERGCSLSVEKRLREGRARRDQIVRFDAERGVADVTDPKISQTRFDVGACPLDILSALFVMRERGVPEDGSLKLAVFDNGKRYTLGFRVLGRETLDLPPPLGPSVATVVVEPQLVKGSGLFVKQGRLKLWITDDARRIPVRIRSKAAVGSVAADLEAYTPPLVEPASGRP